MYKKYLQLVSDLGIFAIGNLLSKMILFFLLPLYTASMTAEEYAIAELINNATEILFPVMTLAICESVFRYTVEKGTDKDAILYESFRLIIKGQIIAFVCLFIVQQKIHYQYMYYYVFVIICYSIRMLLANYAKGCGYTKCFSLSGIINASILVILNLILIRRMNYGVEGYLLSIAIAHLISAAVLLFGTNAFNSLKSKKRDTLLLKTMLKYSIPLIPNSVAWWITSMFGRYVILSVEGATAAGLYTAAIKLPAIIAVIAQVFQQSWQLSASREVEDKNYNKFYENILKIYSAGVFVVGSIGICITPILVKIMLKGTFLEAGKYVPMMMLACVVQCMTIYYGAILIAFKQTKDVMKGMVLGACNNIIISLVLIHIVGIWGVVIASVVCYLTILLQRVLIVNKIVYLGKNYINIIFVEAILVLQAILMSLQNVVCVGISVVLFFLILIILVFSYKTELYKFFGLLKNDKFIRF